MSRTLLVLAVVVVAALAVLTLLRSRSHRVEPAAADASGAGDAAPQWTTPQLTDDPELTAALKLAKEGHAAEAESALRKVIARDPKNVIAHAQLADLLDAADRLEEALVEYDAALALRPDQPHLMYDRSYVLLTLGRDEEGLREAEALGAIRPEMAEPFFLRCAAHVDDDPKLALSECEEYVRRAWLGREQIPGANPPRQVIEKELLYGVAKKALGDERAAAAYLGEKYLELAAGDEFKEMPLYYLQKYVDLTAVDGDPDKARFERTVRIYKDVKARASKVMEDLPGLGALDQEEREKMYPDLAAAMKKYQPRPTDPSATPAQPATQPPAPRP